VFDRATIVVADRHSTAAARYVPDWWGVLVADHEHDTLVLREQRVGGINTQPSAYARAQLLWREEMLELLAAFGRDYRAQRCPRRVLIEHMVTDIPADALADQVRRCLRRRAC
jgi:hypothetical protein